VVRNAGGYIRVSTEEQARRGVSLESQESAIRDYCDKHDLRLVDLYIDRGITARKKLNKRLEFMRMMRDVQHHKIEHIVVLRLDRFFRNTYDYHRMMKEYLEPNGCDWSAVMEDYNTTTTNGRLMINLRLAIAEQECDIDGDRIRDVFHNRIKQGYVVTGKQARGYDITPDKRMVPNGDADLIRDIFDDFLLTGSVHKTLRNMSGRISLNYKSFRQLLSKEIYIGKYRDNENFCEPIIDKDVFRRAQLLLQKNTWDRPIDEREPFLFSGLMVCAQCGRNMGGGRTTKGVKIYRCMQHFNNARCPNNHTKSETVVEKFLLENVIPLWEQNKIEAEAAKAKAPKKTNRQAIEEKLKRLNRLYINDHISYEEYVKTYRELESQIIDDDHLQEDTPSLSRADEALTDNFKGSYALLSAEEKRAFWKGILKAIVFDGENLSLTFL